MSTTRLSLFGDLFAFQVRRRYPEDPPTMSTFIFPRENRPAPPQQIVDRTSAITRTHETRIYAKKKKRALPPTLGRRRVDELLIRPGRPCFSLSLCLFLPHATSQCRIRFSLDGIAFPFSVTLLRRPPGRIAREFPINCFIFPFFFPSPTRQSANYR